MTGWYTPFHFGGEALEQELKTLYDAQKYDLQILELQRKVVAAPNRIEALDRELQGIIDKVEREKTIIEELDKERKKKERDLEVEREKIKKLESKLYDLKTNKEYQALLKEIETIKTANDALEEDILVLMDKVEEFKKDFENTQAFLKVRQKEIDEEKKILRDEISSIDRDIASLTKHRDDLLILISQNLKNIYEMLREKRNGVAVVNVRNGVCLGCYMNIPPQLFIEVTKNLQIINCPSCNRIFFYSEED